MRSDLLRWMVDWGRRDSWIAREFRKKSINIYAELSLGISYGQPDLSAVTITEYDPLIGVTTKRTFIPNGFIWIDGVKVDVLNVTEVVTDLTGKVVERTTYSLEVTDAAEALGLLRDYAEYQLDAPGAEGAEDRMWGGSSDGEFGLGGVAGDRSQQVSGGGSSGPIGARPSTTPVNSPDRNSGGEGGSQQTSGGSSSGPTNPSSGGTTTNQAGNNCNGNTHTDSAGRTRIDPGFVGPQLILLDLDGDGVKITKFDKSSQFELLPVSWTAG